MAQAALPDGYAGALKAGVQEEARENRFKYIPVKATKEGRAKMRATNCPPPSLATTA